MGGRGAAGQYEAQLERERVEVGAEVGMGVGGEVVVGVMRVAVVCVCGVCVVRMVVVAVVRVVRVKVAGVAGVAVQVQVVRVGLGAGVVAVAVAGVVGVVGVAGVLGSARVVRNHWGSALAPLHSCTVPSAIPSAQAEGLLPSSRTYWQGTPALHF